MSQNNRRGVRTRHYDVPETDEVSDGLSAASCTKVAASVKKRKISLDELSSVIDNIVTAFKHKDETTIPLAMEILQKLRGLLAGSDIFWSAVDAILDDCKREVFIWLHTDELRWSWITKQHRLRMSHNNWRCVPKRCYDDPEMDEGIDELFNDACIIVVAAGAEECASRCIDIGARHRSFYYEELSSILKKIVTAVKAKNETTIPVAMEILKNLPGLSAETDVYLSALEAIEDDHKSENLIRLHTDELRWSWVREQHRKEKI